jgi:hypothetical protein
MEKLRLGDRPLYVRGYYRAGPDLPNPVLIVSRDDPEHPAEPYDRFDPKTDPVDFVVLLENWIWTLLTETDDGLDFARISVECQIV